jgi:MBG domain (YGX type)
VTATYSRTVGETVAGSPYTISATLSPAGVLGNYNITYNTASFTITKRDASVTPAAASKIYGDADPALTGTLSGFVAGDGVTATYSRTVGETVAGSPYTISATLSPVGVLGNYNITYNTASFTITKRDATWTTATNSKTYGDADPDPVTTGSGSNFVDSVTATYSRVPGETVTGGPYHITATLSAGAGVLDNYNITNEGADFTITPKSASVTPAAASKVYGSADPAFTGALSGFLAGDGVTASYSRTTGETVLGSPYTISATLSPAGVLSNYSITYNTANFTITPKSASVTPAAASKVYGSADPAFTGTLSGFLAGDGVTATYSRTAGETVLGGPYTISAVLSPAAVLTNYSITYNMASFTITTKPASVTPNAASKVYGGADPAFTGTLSGFLASDGVTATYSRTTGETVLGSPYTISATLSPAGVLTNYSITYNTANFTITPKAATWTTNPNSKTYGASDSNPLTTGSGSGFLVGDGVTATYTRAAGELPGTYHITATLSPAGVLSNYTITNTGATFSIGYGTCTGGTPGGVILPPINPDGSSVWKVGSTIPVKFTVCGANGQPISDASAVFASGYGTVQWINTVRGTVDNINEAPFNDIPDTAFRWTGGQWIFNMATSNLQKNNTYQYRIPLKNGDFVYFTAGTK